jgi:hypothetical protein
MVEHVTASSDVITPATVEAAPLLVVDMILIVVVAAPVVVAVIVDACVFVVDGFVVVGVAVFVVDTADERATSARRQNTIANVVLIFASLPLSTI